MSLSDCLPCEPGKFQASEGSSACTDCAAGKYFAGTYGSSEAVCAPCLAGTYSPLSVTTTMLCTSSAPSAPACQVVFTSLSRPSSLTVTIEVANTDFASSDEYVSAVVAGGQTIGTNYLTTGGEDDNCAKMSRIVDEQEIPASLVSSDGELVVRIETSLTVFDHACDGSYLYARVSLHFQSSVGATTCVDCAAGRYAAAAGAPTCTRETLSTPSIGGMGHGHSQCIWGVRYMTQMYNNGHSAEPACPMRLGSCM